MEKEFTVSREVSILENIYKGNHMKMKIPG